MKKEELKIYRQEAIGLATLCLFLGLCLGWLIGCFMTVLMTKSEPQYVNRYDLPKPEEGTRFTGWEMVCNYDRDKGSNAFPPTIC